MVGAGESSEKDGRGEKKKEEEEEKREGAKRTEHMRRLRFRT